MLDNRENSIDIEEEQLFEDGHISAIHEPFDPKDVDIIAQNMVVSNLVDRMEYDDIILTPDFQRLPNLWDDQKQSRLIESLIIKIPLPSFYFDYTSDDKLIVVDGQQRLYSIYRFMVLKKGDPNKLKLSGLEYLSEYEGKYYEDLSISIQRRIREQAITAYVIRTGTPEEVRTSIFERINTGGLTLTRAEIRNSVYRGQAAKLLRELAHSQEFIEATRGKVESLRMSDCELVNRSLAFYLLGMDSYEEDYDRFLDRAMAKLQGFANAEIQRVAEDFLRAMRYSYEIFGKTAFRKITKNGTYGKMNKPLYECVSVQLALLGETECKLLLKNKDIFIEKYICLQKDEEFTKSISSGTGKRESVKRRHNCIRGILMEVVRGDSVSSD